MKNKVRPTKLQLRTLEIKKLNPDMPMGQAMLKAGYALKTSIAPKHNLLDSRGVEVAMEKYQEELAGLGLTHKKVAEKLAEWIDAKKISTSLTEPDKIIPDYQTQLKAGEMLRTDLGFKNEDVEQNIDKQIIFQIIKDKHD